MTMQQQATDVGSTAAGLGQGAVGSGPGAGAENLLQMLTMQDVVHEGGAAGLLLRQGAGSGEHTPSLTMQDVVHEFASDEDLTGKHLRRAMQVGGGGGMGRGRRFRMVASLECVGRRRWGAVRLWVVATVEGAQQPAVDSVVGGAPPAPSLPPSCPLVGWFTRPPLPSSLSAGGRGSDSGAGSAAQAPRPTCVPGLSPEDALRIFSPLMVHSTPCLRLDDMYGRMLLGILAYGDGTGCIDPAGQYARALPEVGSLCWD